MNKNNILITSFVKNEVFSILTKRLVNVIYDIETIHSFQ